MAALKISMLGPLQVSTGIPIHHKFESNKVRALFAYLAVEMARPHSREILAEMLWPDAAAQSGLANLRYALADLRKVIGDDRARPPHLIVSRDSLQFNVSSDFEFDVLQFTTLLTATDIEKLKQGIALYRGDLLTGFPSIESDPFEEWVLLKREQLKRQAIEALKLLTDHHEQRCEYQQALPFARRQVELEPWLEEAHQQLMRTLALDGQRSAALAQFETCRRLLASELDVEPTQETTQLYEAILDGRLEKVPHLLKHEPPAPGNPPFKGLRHFDETDAGLFFGREILVAHLLEQFHGREKTGGPCFLAVIGASGSGKSSLVRAGLLPALKKTGRLTRTYTITPAEHPIESLTQVSRDINHNAQRSLLFVDQFEEIFSLCQEENERRSFIDRLLEMEKSLLVGLVIALRADYYAACAPYEGLRKLLSQYQVYIGPMNTSELRRAMEEPARRNGWQFEPGLVDLILHDIGAEGDRSPEPGALPLLSHALLETWRRRSGRVLTLAGYAESGGVHGAITKTAETVFAQLSPEEQFIARNIFLRLTELGEEFQETRRRAQISELVRSPGTNPLPDKTIETVLKLLSDARLVITTETTAEVAHEALIREWARLHEWLTENREGLRLHRHITESAREWQNQGRDLELVYRGARLAQALEWADAHSGDLNLLEHEFLDASEALAKRETAEREAQRQRELEAAQKLADSERQRAEEQVHLAGQLRKRAVYLLVASVLAGILAIASFLLRQQAVRNTDVARSNELAASSISSLTADPELSILLALQAIETYHTSSAEDALHRAVQASRVRSTLTGHTDEIYDVDFSPDGTMLASASLDHTAKVWDFASRKELFTLKGHTDEVWQIEFSPDGKRLATASLDGTAKIWDSEKGTEIFTLSDHTAALADIRYSPDGKLLVTLFNDHLLVVWDAESGRKLITFPEAESELLTPLSSNFGLFSFSPDGTKIAMGYGNGVIKVWDILTQQEVLTLVGEPGVPVYMVSFSPDGTELVSNNYNDDVIVWDLRSGEQLALLNGYYAGFDPTGSLLAMFTGVGAVEVYDASNYQKIYAYTGQAAGGNGVIFNNEGTLLATPNADGTVGIWDMTNGRELFTLLGHANGVGDAAFSPGCVQSPFPQCSQYLVTASRDKTIKIWDVTPAGNREVVTVPGSVTFFNPADKRLVTGTLNDDLTTMTYHLWDITTMGDQREVASFPVTHPVRIYDGSYSFDSALVGTVSVDGTVKILDLGTGAETLTFTPPEPIVSAIDVSIPASGPRLTAISPNKELTVWDAMTGKKLATLPQLYDIVTTVSFSPDGNQMVIVSEESPTATLWDIQSGKKLFDLAGHTQPLYYSVFSQDGKRMATVGKDGIAMVWDAQTGKRLFTLAGHSASIQAAVFSKDGTRLATGGVDGIAKVWDIPDDPNAGKELLDLSGYSPYIFTMDFRPDGRYLATSSFGEGITRVYALQIEDLIAIARSRLTRSMTPEECKKYLHRTTCP